MHFNLMFRMIQNAFFRNDNDRVKCDRGYLFTLKTVVNAIDSNQNQKTDALQIAPKIFKNI